MMTRSAWMTVVLASIAPAACGDDSGGGAPDDAGGDADSADDVGIEDDVALEDGAADEGIDDEGGDGADDEGDACVPTDPERCDGLDNNCDGETDEGFDLGAACTSGIGPCEAAGTLACAADGLSAVCDAEPGEGSPETCNATDDDCDGLTDEYGACAASCFTVAPGTERCSYPLSDANTTPALGLDGTVYITASDTSNPRLHALAPEDCTATWVITFADEGYFTSPAVGEGGAVYVAFTSMFSDIPSRILAFDPDGSDAWSLPFATEFVAPRGLALGADGTIYFGDGNSGGRFYAVTSDGALKWALDIGGSEFRDASAVGPDGTIYAGTWQYLGGPPAAVYAVVDEGDHGRIAWEFAPAAGAFSLSHSPAVGPDGTVYAGLFLPGTGDIVLYAIDPATGDEVWHYDMGATTTANSALAVGADGAVYARSTDGRVHAVLPDGTPKWTPYDAGSIGWYAAPVLGADGSVCIGGGSGFLCLDGADGSLIWEATVAGDAGSPTIAPNGAVFFPTTSAFYALCGASRGLADAPWPKDLHDERNTANSVGW